MMRPVALPPYRTFEPGLTAAERLFDTPPFAAVLAVLPDTREAAVRLNALLDGTGARPRLVGTPGGWTLIHVGTCTQVDEEAQAAVALAELIALAGWRRLKRCATCGRAFVDRTNGCSRRWCDDHRRGG